MQSVPSVDSSDIAAGIGDEEAFNAMEIATTNTQKATDEMLAQRATNVSWLVNWILLIIKIVIAVSSSSKVVIASLVDSAVDLISQFVLTWSQSYANYHSPDYPVGKSRIEALSVLGCGAIMIFSSIEVIQACIEDLVNGFNGKKPELFVGVELYVILGLCIGLKFALYVYCTMISKRIPSSTDILDALAEDHLNDVWSNAAAIVSVSIAYNTKAWYVDQAMAILITCLIIGRWVNIMQEQIKKIVGYTAPQEFIEQVNDIARDHDTRIIVDVTRAYHYGARYNVEMEIVLPGNMTVIESHDIALALQHKIESLSDVERAFVHVDHQERDGLEHKVERELVMKLVNTKGSDSVGSPAIHRNIGGELRNRQSTRT
jgi:cation diffusion facilitator family transporter